MDFNGRLSGLPVFMQIFLRTNCTPVFERMNIGVGELIHSLQGERQ